ADGPRDDATRRRRLLPALVRAEGEAAGWELDGLALGVATHDDHERAGRIVPASARQERGRSLLGGHAQARRPFEHAPGAVAVTAGGLFVADDLVARGGARLQTWAGRGSLSGDLTV